MMADTGDDTGPLVGKWLAGVCVYTDDDAFVRDELRRLQGNVKLKGVHDELFQLAIKLKLASLLTVMDWQRPDAFRAACRVEVSRPAWWPANQGSGNRRDLLALPLAPTAEARLGKDWRVIRGHAENDRKRATLWHDDPALSFSPGHGVWLGWAASVGHEGLVHYFVYGSKEQQWADALETAGLQICARGESAYRDYFKVPGQLAGA
jgi:hypothetical protein